MRPVETDRVVFGPGRMGRVRVLRLAFAPFLGPAAAPDRPLGGLPIRVALTGAKADQRQTLLGILTADPDLVAQRPGQTLICDKNYFGAGFETELAEVGIALLRPARKGEAERPGSTLFKPLRQTIESINQTCKAQLDLERHGGRTPAGLIVRVLQRILALSAAIWHNDHTGAPVHRSLTAYDPLESIVWKHVGRILYE
ncbi:hypothetical protein AB4305_20765 [Nocardia sp. 2YAB30]